MATPESVPPESVRTIFHSDSRSGHVTDEKFAWAFNAPGTALRPFLFTLPERKPPGTLRTCLLGESAAMGTPDPAFGCGRILEVWLGPCYPDRRFEVANAAMRGINSPIIRGIASECAEHQVDLFLVCMGNNEVNGPFGLEPNSKAWAQSLLLIHAGQWAKASRLGQGSVSLAGRAANACHLPKPKSRGAFPAAPA